jgi:hypothetical protein
MCTISLLEMSQNLYLQLSTTVLYCIRKVLLYVLEPQKKQGKVALCLPVGMDHNRAFQALVYQDKRLTSI